MAQENGPQDRADDARDLLILWSVPDDREQHEHDLYEDRQRQLEDVET